MPPRTGSFDNSGSPRIRIHVRGVYDNAAREFDAIIDTGFTGFLSMPLVDAFPLGLILEGTTEVVLADNSRGTHLTAMGFAGIENGPGTPGIIILEWSQGDVLAGMDFLRSLNHALLVAPHSGVVLLEDDHPPQPQAADSPT